MLVSGRSHACGKTELSLQLAEHLDAEILALDSMSLYRGMDIGTAKASPAEQQSIPHHLIDVIDPHEEFSVADYLTAAEQCCREIIDRGHVPLFVGGTGLYLRAVLRGVFEGPAADWDYRRELEQFVEAKGNLALHARLAEVDPVSAKNCIPTISAASREPWKFTTSPANPFRPSIRSSPPRRRKTAARLLALP